MKNSKRCIELTEKQLENYKREKLNDPTEMTEEEIKSFEKELSSFLQEKLGDRTFVGIISYENMRSGHILYNSVPVGLDRKTRFFSIINCLKMMDSTRQQITRDINAPMQPITSENNPFIRPKDSAELKQ